MDNHFFLRDGPAQWPVDVRSVGKERWQDKLPAERPQGAPFAIFMWTVEGAGWVEYLKQRHELCPGDLFIMPVDTAHRYGGASGWLVRWFTLDGALCEPFLRELGMGRPMTTRSSPGLDFQRLEQAVESLDRIQFAMRIAFKTAEKLKRSGSSEKAARFSGLLDWARDNVNFELNVDALARRSGLSRSHFSREFTAETGMPPVRFIMDIKLAQAKGLLLNSTKSVKEIAGECGFFDTAHFSRQFQRFTGMKPTLFRSQTRI